MLQGKGLAPSLCVCWRPCYGFTVAHADGLADVSDPRGMRRATLAVGEQYAVVKVHPRPAEGELDLGGRYGAALHGFGFGEPSTRSRVWHCAKPSVGGFHDLGEVGRLARLGFDGAEFGIIGPSGRRAARFGASV